MQEIFFFELFIKKFFEFTFVTFKYEQTICEMSTHSYMMVKNRNMSWLVRHLTSVYVMLKPHKIMERK